MKYVLILFLTCQFISVAHAELTAKQEASVKVIVRDSLPYAASFCLSSFPEKPKQCMQEQLSAWGIYAKYSLEMGHREECIRSGIPAMDHVAQMRGEPNGYVHVNAGLTIDANAVVKCMKEKY